MDYLNRANSVLNNANTAYNNANSMMNSMRQPGFSQLAPPQPGGGRYPMQNQFYNPGIKETFYDSMAPSEWWIVLALLIGLFIMLYWLVSKKGKEAENLMLL